MFNIKKRHNERLAKLDKIVSLLGEKHTQADEMVNLVIQSEKLLGTVIDGRIEFTEEQADFIKSQKAFLQRQEEFLNALVDIHVKNSNNELDTDDKSEKLLDELAKELHSFLKELSTVNNSIHETMDAQTSSINEMLAGFLNSQNEFLHKMMAEIKGAQDESNAAIENSLARINMTTTSSSGDSSFSAASSESDTLLIEKVHSLIKEKPELFRCIWDTNSIYFGCVTLDSTLYIQVSTGQIIMPFKASMSAKELSDMHEAVLPIVSGEKKKHLDIFMKKYEVPKV
jgi:hypothetical protein